jgi:hypothetical protein
VPSLSLQLIKSLIKDWVSIRLQEEQKMIKEVSQKRESLKWSKRKE